MHKLFLFQSLMAPVIYLWLIWTKSNQTIMFLCFWLEFYKFVLKILIHADQKHKLWPHPHTYFVWVSLFTLVARKLKAKFLEHLYYFSEFHSVITTCYSLCNTLHLFFFLSHTFLIHIILLYSTITVIPILLKLY